MSPSPLPPTHSGIDTPPVQNDHGGDTALHTAAWNGRTRVVELLVEAGADPRAKTDVSGAPLRAPSRPPHFLSPSHLTPRAPPLLPPSPQLGCTPSDYARHNGHTEIAAMLEARPPRSQPPCGAVVVVVLPPWWCA